MTEPFLPEESLFAQALEIGSAAERAAFLDRACGDNAALRVEVEALLRAHERSGDVLDLPDSPGAPMDEPSSEKAGTVIGQYKLLQQIGEGGMGVVWMAEQTEPVKRKVALKVIKPGMDSRQVIARFEAERQALAMMDHVNIARVFDGGATENGRPYFVMELVHGVPITKYCDDNHLTPRQRLELFVPVCQAIQHAHQKGIIHRDIKPSNVMVTLYDGKPVPKVIDFGVAKATEQRLTERTLFTQYGTMVGTLEYMSPEQAEMSALGVDTRSDIYSLGVLMYELLTGSTPLTHKRMKEAAYAEILRMIKEEEPPKPSTRLSDSGEALASISANRQMEPARLTKLVRGELDWIVMKTLEKDRNRRYETANGLAQDVQRYLHDETVEACPPSAWYRLRKFVRRNQVALLTIGVVVLALVTGSVVSIWQAVRATLAEADTRIERDKALAEKERADEEAAIAKAVNDFLQNDLLDEAAPDKNARNKKVTVEEVLGRAAARIGGKFEKQPAIEAAIRQTIGRTYYTLSDYPAAQPHLERALELRRRVLGDEHPGTLLSMNNLALLYKVRGQYPKAEPLFVEALETKRRVLGEEHPDTLNSMNSLGLLFMAQGQYLKAEALIVKALDAKRRVLGEEHRDTLESLNSLAALFQKQGQYAKAEPLFVKALEISRRVLGEEHPGTLLIMNNLALQYRQQDQPAKAEPLFRETLEIKRRVLGEEHHSTLISMYNLAGVYSEQYEYAKAEPLNVKAVEVSRRILGEEHPDTLLAMGNLALLYRRQRQYVKAEPLLVQSQEIKRRVLGEEHPSTLFSTYNLAGLYHDQGQYDKAEPLFVKTLEVSRRVLSEEHPLTLNSINSLAKLYQDQGQYAKAEPLYREALGKARKRQGDPSPPTADALASLGLNLLHQKKYADAEPLLRECVAIREQHLPDEWETFSAKSQLGGSLLGQKKYADAEPLLVAGYEGMKQRETKIPPEDKPYLTTALERLTQLYDAWGKKEQADQWRKKLEVHREAEKKEQPKKK